jgi:trehalose 6-phosphate synthase/phosphatase
MGDDRTDEDLFAALPKDAWSIFVGDGVTKAKYRLARPADVSRVLQRLVD